MELILCKWNNGQSSSDLVALDQLKLGSAQFFHEDIVYGNFGWAIVSGSDGFMAVGLTLNRIQSRDGQQQSIDKGKWKSNGCKSWQLLWKVGDKMSRFEVERMEWMNGANALCAKLQVVAERLC